MADKEQKNDLLKNQDKNFNKNSTHENNPIIIDGVDVSGCISFDKNNEYNICCYDDIREDKIPFANFCVENKNCYYKQLKRKEQECEELKEECEEHRSNAESYCKSYQYSCVVNGKITDKALKYKQALDEIAAHYQKVIKNITNYDDSYDASISIEALHNISDIINKAKGEIMEIT